MEENLKKYDAVIIGSGKGGRVTAGALGTTSKTVALAERSSIMCEGTCINVGCIPTKSLVYRARLAAVAGRTFEERSAVYRGAMEQKENLTRGLGGRNYQEPDSNPNITVIDGNARFISPHIVEMTYSEGVFQAEGEMIFVNIGSQTFIPPVGGLKDNPYVYTSEGLLSRRELPEKLVIIGGRYIDVELSSVYMNSGLKATIFQDGDVFPPREDEEVTAAVKASLESGRIRVLVGIKVKAAEQEGDGTVVVIDAGEGGRRLQIDMVLVATGHRPNTEGLNLEVAGVGTDTGGDIVTDGTLTTVAPHTYAIGGMRGGLQPACVSLGDLRIARSAVLGSGSYDLKKWGTVPYSVFLDPSPSRVGLGEKEIIKAGYRVKTARLAATAAPETQVLGQSAGLLRAVIDEGAGLILGTHLFCREPYGMISMIKLAIDAKISYIILRDAIYTRPAMNEVFNDLFTV